MMKNYFAAFGLLVVAVLLIGIAVGNLYQPAGVSVSAQPLASTPAAVEPAVVTSTTKTPTTTSTVAAAAGSSELTVTTTVAETTTTTTVFVDLPDPIRMFSDDLGADVAVSTRSCSADPNEDSPCPGEIQWIPLGLDRIGACENGPVIMLGHLNDEGFYNLINDSPADRFGSDDRGLQVGGTMSFDLAGGATCTYEVVQPLVGAEVEGVTEVNGQPFVYFSKESTIKNRVYNALLADYPHEPILMALASYGGPDATEIEDGHRLNNGAVFFRLLPEGSS